MNFKRSSLAILALSWILGLSATAASVSPTAGVSGYHLLKSIALPGDKGWDLLADDSAAGRLYVSHGDQVLVIDTNSDTLVAQLGPFEGTHGIALVPDLDRGYISDGRANSVACFDLRTLTLTAQISVGKNPDVILVDPLTLRVWAFTPGDGSVTVIQAGDNRVLQVVDLGGSPEFAVADGKGRIYVNLEDKSQLLKIDANKMKVLQRWSIAPGLEPSSLSMDVKHHRLFLGCRNHMTVVVNSDSGKVVANLPIGDHVDGSAFDPLTGLIFHSCGDGTLSVIHESSPDKYSLVENVSTEKGARTIALDPKTHRLYLPAAEFGEAPAPTAEKPHPWPSMKPGSFHLLVFGRD